MNDLLLVEDNADIQDVNKFFLERRGYKVRIAMNLAEARQSMMEATPDLIVLDIMLSDGSGLDFLKELREENGSIAGRNIPVLLLTALSETSDEIKGMQYGGDDYITKPYENDLLLARIQALLRRAERVPEIITKGSLKLETFSHQAIMNGENLGLTRKEFDLVFLLAQNEDRLLTTETLYEKVWGQPMIEDTNAIRTIASRVRNKIEQSGYTVEVVRNKGYIFTKL